MEQGNHSPVKKRRNIRTKSKKVFNILIRRENDDKQRGFKDTECKPFGLLYLRVKEKPCLLSNIWVKL
jgi:hypothetical protein